MLLRPDKPASLVCGHVRLRVTHSCDVTAWDAPDAVGLTHGRRRGRRREHQHPPLVRKDDCHLQRRPRWLPRQQLRPAGRLLIGRSVSVLEARSNFAEFARHNTHRPVTNSIWTCSVPESHTARASSVQACDQAMTVGTGHLLTHRRALGVQAGNSKYQRVFGAPNPTAKSLWTSQVSITGASSSPATTVEKDVQLVAR